MTDFLQDATFLRGYANSVFKKVKNKKKEKKKEKRRNRGDKKVKNKI